MSVLFAHIPVDLPRQQFGDLRKMLIVKIKHVRTVQAIYIHECFCQMFASTKFAVDYKTFERTAADLRKKFSVFVVAVLCCVVLCCVVLCCVVLTAISHLTNSITFGRLKGTLL
jgi:hypothetical protein